VVIIKNKTPLTIYATLYFGTGILIIIIMIIIYAATIVIATAATIVIANAIATALIKYI
jgi:hypothetical protein